MRKGFYIFDQILQIKISNLILYLIFTYTYVTRCCALHCKKLLALFPSPAGMSLLGVHAKGVISVP
jgi:hypothetical protein